MLKSKKSNHDEIFYTAGVVGILWTENMKPTGARCNGNHGLRYHLHPITADVVWKNAPASA